MSLTYLSLFSGIGGLDLGFDRAGMTCVGQCEIDPKARAVLARHWPGVPKHDDIRTLRGADYLGVDVVVGGFPCQDLSMAGRRGGLAGERSGLWWQMARVISECRPRWVVAENVPGLLSACCPCPGDGGHDGDCDGPHPIPGGSCPGGCMDTHGGAMGAVLGSLAELGYGFAYASLDAQYFGVAQRRERVFIVGHLGAPWSAPAEVLFDPESVRGDSPPSRATGARVAVRAEDGADTGSGIVMTLAPTLQGGGKRGHRIDAETAAGGGWSSVLTTAVTSSHGGADDNDAQGGHLVVTHALTAEGFDASEDGTGRGTPPVVASAITAREGKGPDSDATTTLIMGFHPTQDPISTVEQSPALGHDPMAVAFSENQRGEVVTTEYAHQLTTGGGKPGQGYPAVFIPKVTEAVATWDERNVTSGAHRSRVEFDRPSNTLHAEPLSIIGTAGVRRLTPMECERLQGFPDGWTDGQADGPRYRQLGNAVCVPVAEWIARRIAASR